MHKAANYYQRKPQKHETTSSERFPQNHVRFSSILKPLQWIDLLYKLFGSQAFSVKKAVLKEFDSAGPLDKDLGTEKELKEHRKLVESYCKGIDNNPYLSPIGRFLLKKITLDTLKNRKRVLQFYQSNKSFIRILTGERHQQLDLLLL